MHNFFSPLSFLSCRDLHFNKEFLASEAPPGCFLLNPVGGCEGTCAWFSLSLSACVCVCERETGLPEHTEA